MPSADFQLLAFSRWRTMPLADFQLSAVGKSATFGRADDNGGVTRVMINIPLRDMRSGGDGRCPSLIYFAGSGQWNSYRICVSFDNEIRIGWGRLRNERVILYLFVILYCSKCNDAQYNN